MVRVCRLLVTLALLVVAGPPQAHATFHFMSISELGAGFLGDPNVQFVELRLDANGQTNLTDTRLTAFDKDGIPTVLLLTPSGVVNGTTGRTVLYATTEFTAATGVTPDFIIPAGVVSPSGMICWGAPGTIPPDPMTWDPDKANNYVDCVAYGSYLGFTRPSSGTPTNLTPGDGIKSLTRAKNNSVTGSNDTDFVLAAARPCNNANQCALLTPTPSKPQLACRRAIIKAARRFAAAHVRALTSCESDRLKGKLSGPCPDLKAGEKIAAAQTTRTKAITKACGALTPADAGFGATCPGYTGSCTDPIASVTDVSTCIDCAARRAGQELTGTVFAAPPDAARLRCQLGLGKTVAGYARAVAALLTKCEDGVARGKIAAPCPDTKTASAITAKSLKLRGTLCKACGGTDKRCDGSDDATPAILGITSCPARTNPGGPACGAIAIGDLTDVVACVECLANFESTCTTALSAHPETLPDACDPAP